ALTASPVGPARAARAETRAGGGAGASRRGGRGPPGVGGISAHPLPARGRPPHSGRTKRSPFLTQPSRAPAANANRATRARPVPRIFERRAVDGPRGDTRSGSDFLVIMAPETPCETAL